MANPFISSALLGTAMPLQLTWQDLVVRLVCTLIAGAIIGYDRGERGKAAGLRTTILVCLAASVAMLQMNYPLTLSGKASDSFITNDLMRLPLGILTGVGFIGGGAILRRGSLVIGVTTAATLWYVTVIGLCFGGGQVLLGWAATAIGFLVLRGLRRLESYMAVEQHARLQITVDETGPGEQEIRDWLAKGAIRVRNIDLASGGGSRTYTLNVLKVHEPRAESACAMPAAVERLSRRPGVRALAWQVTD